ncbi:TIM barrel protein [Streptomyces sp. NPDC050856]|uniref:TIM barrel protein n=1 Tax=Streptomyces sp. NPDC050856 TaxID=3154939 RepID=UPI0033BFFC91
MNLDRVAAAPISWGVCEVPGWGHQMAADRVLREMAGLGLSATEFGPDGFLPGDPRDRAALLGRHGMRAVGGFVPLVLHDPAADPVPVVRETLRDFTAAGADTLVLAAATGLDGYDTRPVLDSTGWRTLLARLDRLNALAAEAGVTAALHPHVGTMVEGPQEVDRVLDGSDIGLCLDTGHLLIGGTDPVRLAGRASSRVVHVHLKDVDLDAARALRAGLTPGYGDAVATGLYRPLGRGGIDLTTLVDTLEGAGYRGWYVMEQDVVLTTEPPAEAGPLTGVRASLDWLRGR